MLTEHLGITKEGRLSFCGFDTALLAGKYGTPLMLYDENMIRGRMRLYRDTLKAYFGEGSMPLLASKALSCKEIYRIAAEEGIGTDLVSPGELYTAHSAGFPLSRAFFHGNNKTPADIAFALDCGIGYFITDNMTELSEIDRQAEQRGITQKLLLRLTPGIDPHTHAKISTGRVDSKFGAAIETGQAEELLRAALSCRHVSVRGVHCHIGSQIFETSPFIDAALVMLRFLAKMKEKLGFTAEYLNLGGGFGVRYTEEDPEIDYRENLKAISDALKEYAAKMGMALPLLLMEPGRSMVADAGITLYTAGNVKEIPGFRTYVSIDGGMSDNPRYSLYGSRYTILNATHADREPDLTATIAGRLCESGDLIGEGIRIARPVPGDLVAVLVTGAYHYAMASNYNRIPRPAVVFLKDGTDRVVIRRETCADLCRLDN